MLVVASEAYSDGVFLEKFRTLQLQPSEFRHGDHLRLAWIELHQNPVPVAMDRVRSGIRNFAAHLGAAHKYHETITCAWVRLLATHHEPTFAQFLEGNRERLSADLLYRFWSPELLQSEQARTHWVDPDRQPLPPLA